MSVPFSWLWVIQRKTLTGCVWCGLGWKRKIRRFASVRSGATSDAFASSLRRLRLDN